MIRGDDLKSLRSLIGTHFKVYDVRWDIESAAFFCDIDTGTLEKDFDDLRMDLLPKGYIPMILYEGGEYIIYITEKAQVKYKSVRVNLILLIATICTTVFVGAMNWWSYDSSLDPGDFNQVFTLTALGNGALFFALPLMLILGIHETGHYLMARHHGVAASLPFFIPVPLPPLGTFGAFISMREPIPSKKALLDIGVAGPISGFCVAIPVIIIGFILTNVYAMRVPEDSGSLVFLGTSIFYDSLGHLVPSGDYLTHPMALAGWVGLLVTFLNLLPAGQLDGGHVARALFGDNAKYFSYISIIVMIGLAIYFQYPGWFLFILIIIFIGVGHPPPLNDISKLDAKRWLTGALVLIILMGCFTPVPLYPAEINYGGKLTLSDGSLNLVNDTSVNTSVTMVNLGNVNNEFTLKIGLDEWSKDQGWWASLLPDKDKVSKKPTLTPNIERNATVYVRSPEDSESGNYVKINITLKWKDDTERTHKRIEVLTVMVGLLRMDLEDNTVETAPGTSDRHNLTVNYLGDGYENLSLRARFPPGWDVVFGQDHFEMTPISGYEETTWFSVIVPSGETVSSKNITIELVLVVFNPNSNITDIVNWNETVHVKVLQVFSLGLGSDRDSLIIGNGEKATINISVTNLGNGMDSIEVSIASVANLSAQPDTKVLTLGSNEQTSFILEIEPLVNRTMETNILVTARSQGNPGVLVQRFIEVIVN